MKLDPRSRRAFLQGASGAALAIPFLPSLTRDAAAAAPGPTRFAMMVYPYGNCQRYWWPGAPKSSLPELPTTPSADGSYRTRKLSDIPGDMSPILASPFDVAIRKKMVVIRGLDPLGKPHAHNTSLCTTGDTGENGGMFLWQKMKFAYSVDYVLEKSATFYPTAPALGALRIAPSGDPNPVNYGDSWSWAGIKDGVVRTVRAEKVPRKVYDLVFNGAASLDPKVAARTARLKDITSAVNDDFKDVLANRRLSAHDKNRLEDYMSLVSQIRGKLDGPRVSCSRTSDLESRLATFGDLNQLNGVMIDLEVAALACGTTRIVMHQIAGYGPSFTLNTDGEALHAMAHGGQAGGSADVQKSFEKSKWNAGRFAELIKKLDAVTEPDGNTLLDNTVVVYGSEDTTGAHFLMDMPIVLAGGKGKIKMDQFIDYRNLQDPFNSPALLASTAPDKGTVFWGRPYNNFLVTMLQTFGLTPAEYNAFTGADGFGRYEPFGYDQSGGGHYTRYVSTSSQRNAPLPGLWVG